MYYDSVKDPIKKYFLEKIQVCASSKHSLQVIMEEKVTKTKKEGKRKVNDSEDEEEEEDEEEIAKLEDKLTSMKANLRDRRYSVNTQKQIRSKQVTMEIQTIEEGKQTQQNLPQMINKHMQAAGSNTELVMKGLSSQEERIRQKLEQRRMNSFHKCRHPSSSLQSYG